ncbi:unnamed protein product, partial [marine sediment metagenome]
NFIQFINPQNADKTLSSYYVISKNVTGNLFLLDADYKLIFPETGSQDASVFRWEEDISNSQFVQFFKSAEFFEFSKKNYTRAAELYKKCTLSVSSKKHLTVALEGLGRCLLSSKRYNEAYKVFKELSNNYGQFQNKAGHPYGIIAVFQLYEIDRYRKKKAKNPKILLDLYEKIRNGAWLLNASAYDFFIAEIESILHDKFNKGKFPEIQKSYQDIRKQQSPYRQALVFTDFLKKEVIPKIKEKLSLSQIADEIMPGRFLITLKKDFFLISYAIFPNLQSEQTFYGGFCWNINSLKKWITPKILENTTKDSGINFQIVDEKGQNILTGKEELTSKSSLTLSYRHFPLPWKLLVSHPEIKALERTARREIFFYGVLLTVIVALMLLGAVLIARDISRESETTRLKTEFVHNVSHELKTPLTLIRLYGETLQRKENLTDEEKKESYEIITKESERLSHLINNVLDFSRIEMGKKEFDIKKG